MKLVLAIDQGTTGTTTALYDSRGRIVARAYREFPQIYPQPGWVEHDPETIWQTVVDTVTELCNGSAGEIAAVGIANQRETTMLWDRRTGRPVHNAIVWQCRRTAPLCDRMKPHEELFRQTTGLPLDPYFSGTKLAWLLTNLPDLDPASLLFGTIDTWLIWRLTGGRLHATDFTNASRTLLFDIHGRRWSDTLCGLLDIPMSVLPEVRPSAGDYGIVSTIPCLSGVPILGVAGDQQAALFGQAGFARGDMKNTYGTGCFALMNTGSEPVASKRGLITTLAVGGGGQSCYALEGAVFIAGAVIQWLRDGLGLIETAADSETAARAVADNAGVYFVPAFVGLGAPHWDMSARGTIVGLTRGTSRNHLVRAALESLAYQSYDVLSAMIEETGVRPPELAVDGGAAANDFLMQFQADIMACPVVRPSVIESTSRGAAFLAGLAAGLWTGCEQLRELRECQHRFEPRMPQAQRQQLLDGWRHALRQARAR